MDSLFCIEIITDGGVNDAVVNMTGDRSVDEAAGLCLNACLGILKDSGKTERQALDKVLISLMKRIQTIENE